MDIGSVSGYLDQVKTQASDTSAGVDRAAKADYSEASDEELLDACKKFESYFIEQVLKEVEKTIPEDELSDSSNSTMVDYYKDQYITDLAEDMTENNSIGLAQQMYEQMKRNLQGTMTAQQLQAQETMPVQSEEASGDADSEESDDSTVVSSEGAQTL